MTEGITQSVSVELFFRSSFIRMKMRKSRDGKGDVVRSGYHARGLQDRGQSRDTGHPETPWQGQEKQFPQKRGMRNPQLLYSLALS